MSVSKALPTLFFCSFVVFVVLLKDYKDKKHNTVRLLRQEKKEMYKQRDDEKM